MDRSDEAPEVRNAIAISSSVVAVSWQTSTEEVIDAAEREGGRDG